MTSLGIALLPMVIATPFLINPIGLVFASGPMFIFFMI